MVVYAGDDTCPENTNHPTPAGDDNGSLIINDPNGVTLASADFTLQMEAGVVPETSALHLFMAEILACLVFFPRIIKQEKRARSGKQIGRALRSPHPSLGAVPDRKDGSMTSIRNPPETDGR
jgi:hypothetical protein